MTTASAGAPAASTPSADVARAPSPPRVRARTWARLRHAALALWSALALLYLFVPIFIVVLFSFNDPKGRFNYTWQGFTLDHWKDRSASRAWAPR